MLDIISLERRWLKYKIKSHLPHLLLLTVTIITFFIAFFLLFSSNKRDLTTIKLTKTSIHEKTVPATLPNENMTLEPSMQFIQSMSSTTQPIQEVQTLPQTLPTKISAKQKAPVVVTTLHPINDTTPSVAVVSTPLSARPQESTMKHDSNSFDIHEIEDRFKVNSNPHLGLYIARYHYEHANYNEAYNYALKTNSINNTMEESWLIFAKSLVKLGKNDQARKTLQLYITQSNSESAKNLLNSIEQGNLK